MAVYNDKLFCIASYNVYGLNNGRSMLTDLCNSHDIAIIAVQEHWLTLNNLHLLNCIHPDFMGFGVTMLTM